MTTRRPNVTVHRTKEFWPLALLLAFVFSVWVAAMLVMFTHMGAS